MSSGYALRNIAWREQLQRAQQQKQKSQGARDADAAAPAASATGGGSTKPRATETRAPGPSNSRHPSSTTTKKKSTTSSAPSMAGIGRNASGGGTFGANAGPQRGGVRAQVQPHANPRPHPTWNAAVGSTGAAPTFTLPLTINLNMTQGETSQLTNDSMLLSCATSSSSGGGGGGAARTSKTNAPTFEGNVPLGQQSLSSGGGSYKSLPSKNPHAHKAYSDGSKVPLGQKSLSSGSHATTGRSHSQPQRACLPTTILHPALGGGPSEYTRRRMEAWLEQEKKEASGPLSIWKRAQQEQEAEESLLASMSAPRGPPALHFGPTQRDYPHHSRWQRAPPPPPLEEPVVQPRLLHPASSKAGLARADVGVDFKAHVDQARETLQTDLAEASKELKAEAARARNELKADAEAALATQRQLFDEQQQEVKRLLDDTRETNHALRADLRNEHAKAKTSLKKVLEHGLNVVNEAFRSKLTSIKEELLKDVLPFTEKYCGKWLTMFRAHEESRKEVVADPARRKGGSSSSADASVIVDPTPRNRKKSRNVSCTPCTGVATNVRSHSPNAVGVPSEPAKSEAAADTPSSWQTAPVKVKNRKQPSSSPKTVSSRSLTPAESKLLPKAAISSKGSTHGHATVKNHLGNATQSRDQPNRSTGSKTAAKQPPTITPLWLQSSATTKRPPVVRPPANTPTRPSQMSGPVKRPRKVAESEAALPPRKKRAPAGPRPRGFLRFSPSDDESAAFK